MTADELAALRLYACSDNCKTVYQAHYDKHEPNCQGEEILELCDEIEQLRADRAMLDVELDAALAEVKATKLSLANTEIELVDTLEDRRALLAEVERLRGDTIAFHADREGLTPDIGEIRSALAGYPGEYVSAHMRVCANAPTWLAACISEIEELRAEVEKLKVERYGYESRF